MRDASEILEMFASVNKSGIDKEGISIPNAISENAAGEITLMALAVPPAEAYGFILKHLVEERPVRFVFGLDRFAKPGQGFEWGDFFSVHFYDSTIPLWKFGAMEYRFKNGKAETKPITWDNEFVKQKIAQETQVHLLDKLMLMMHRANRSN